MQEGSEAQNKVTHTEFRKSLGFFDSTALVVGSMIGSGIFIVSSDIARQVGSPGWLMVVWLISGLMTVFAALSYGEMAGMFPKAGGQYVYLREAYNPLTGFLYGWTLFMVIQTGTIAAVAMAFAKFLGVLLPAVGHDVIWFKFRFITLGPVQLVAIISIIFLTWINTRGIQSGKRVQNVFTSGKVLLLILFIIIGFAFGWNSEAVKINSSYFWDPSSGAGDGSQIPLGGIALIAAIGMAMVGSLFSSDAWNNVTFTAGEVINPKKNIPLSLFTGTMIVTVLYLLANLVYITVLPLRGDPLGLTVMERGIQWAHFDRLGTATMFTIFGNSAMAIMAMFVVISTFGCNNGLILSGARVYFAMARDKVFFEGTGKLNKADVPAKALVYQGIWASLLCLSGTYTQLLDYVVFAVLIFYVLTIIGIFILRKKRPETERPYKAFGYPYIPALYILMATVVMLILLVYKTSYSLPGLVIVLAGIPVYFIWNKRKAKTVR